MQRDFSFKQMNFTMYNPGNNKESVKHDATIQLWCLLDITWPRLFRNVFNVQPNKKNSSLRSSLLRKLWSRTCWRS